MYKDPEKFLEKNNNLIINPLRYGEQRHDTNQVWGPCARDYYLLHYVISGKGTYITSGGTFDVSKGQIFVIYPGEVTTYAADKNDPWKYSWVGFESSITLDDILTSYVIDAAECAHIFQAIVNDSDSSVRKEWYISGKIYELLAYLSSRSSADQSSRSSVDQMRSHHYALMAKAYIAANYKQRLKVVDLAEYVCLDQAYFARIFRKHTGKTPQRYLVDFRLDKAAELLALRRFSLYEVTKEVGYADPTNFSRMFSRRFGISPSAYRDSMIM